MAYLIQPDYVKYACSCGMLKPITSLYFCRHCLKIRCAFCICHEVDSHFCANCLENMPSSEARLKKNRCSSCFECPSCFHTLSTRATLSQPRNVDPSASGDGKVENKQPKKMFYLSCFNCRWTSRDVGIPDQTVASGGWPERSSPFASRVATLLDYYKAVAQQEKHDKMERRYTIRGKYITLTDKTGLTGAMARNLAGLPSSESSAGTALASFAPSQASDEVEGLPEDIYTKEVDLNAVTSMPQRLAAPEWQPASSSRLHPSARALAVKRSQRCRECDHNLTKPEYGPGSIKFKIELLAYYHVPEIKIISYEPLKPGCRTDALLLLTNPTGHEMSLRFVDSEDATPASTPEELAVEALSLDKEKEKKDEPAPYLPSVRTPPQFNAVVVSAPGDGGVALSLAQRDDAAEYDDDAPAVPQHQMIVWRKSNKMAVRVQVETSADISGPVIARAILQYRYMNAVPAAARRQPLAHDLCTTAYLHLGEIVQ